MTVIFAGDEGLLALEPELVISFDPMHTFWRVFRFCVLANLLFLSSSFAASERQCADLFLLMTPTSRMDSSAAIIKALENVQADSVSIIYENILLIAKDPDQVSRIGELILALDRMAERIEAGVLPDLVPSRTPIEGVNKSRLTLEIIRNTKTVLELVKDESLENWKNILVNGIKLERLNEFNTYGLMGYLLRLLPQTKKEALLSYLGDVYSKEKNRALRQPIHVLLDPKAIYDRFKAEGRTDREFYDYYLRHIYLKVFKGKVVGNYSGELVIQIAQLIQKMLIKGDIQAVNFFGSVPIGFGKPTSDLDIYNSPILAEALSKNGADEDEFSDVFEGQRGAVVDKAFASALRKVLAGTPWKWRSEDDGQFLSEHLGGSQHVFSFHITADKIVVRFYYKSIRYDEKGQPMPLPYDYIELDLGV